MMVVWKISQLSSNGFLSFWRLAWFLWIDVNRIFLSIFSVIRSKSRKKNEREREVCKSVRERREYHSPREERCGFFSSQMLLCFIGRLRLLFSCPSPTTTVDKRMTILWTLAGVTGETSRRPINSYFISRFSEKTRIDLSDMHWVIVSFTFCEKRYDICYVIFTCKTDKTLTVYQNYNRYSPSQVESLVGIIQHLPSSSPLPHLKCIVRASCISHTWVAHATEICVANGRPFRRTT